MARWKGRLIRFTTFETRPRGCTIKRQPGSGWEYCNLAFGILDYLVELRSGLPWRRFMEQRVYDPIGMVSSSDRVRPGLEPRASAQYARDAGGRFRRVGAYRFDHDGASAIWSTARDLARFLMLHLGDGELDGTRLLSPEAAREMRRRTSVSMRSGDSGNGVGWFVGSYLGRPSIWHGGGMPGVATQVRAFPEDGAGVVVLTNCGNRGFKDAVCERLCRALLPEAPDRAPVRGAEPEPNLTREDWAGAWHGKIRHFAGDIDLAVEIAGRGAVRARIGAREVRFPQVSLSGRELVLSGPVHVPIETQPCFHGIPRVELRLRREGPDLAAAVCVLFGDGYFCLSHFAELCRR